ncbi:MAG: DUF2911 domain-containing protein [Acidobacteriota bacterium]
MALLAQAPRETVRVSFSGKSVEISYGRPALAGRDMLGRLRPGRPWRMGADSPTSLKTEATLDFNGQTVEPGTYRLMVLKTQEGDWRLLVRSETDGINVAKAVCQSNEGDEEVESFTIELHADGNQGEFKMSWGTLRVSTTFTAN